MTKREEPIMWTRRELKDRAKVTFKKTYWKHVLVSIVLAMVVGTAGGVSSGISSSISNVGNVIGHGVGSSSYDEDDLEDFSNGITDGYNDYKFDWDEREEADSDEENEIGFSLDPESGEFTIDGKTYTIDKPTRAAAIGAAVGVAAAVIIAIMFIGLILSLFGIAVDIFVYNPIEYGCQKFFKRSMDENQSLGVMFNGFKDGYKNIVKVMFFRDLFVFLWSLLFIIPGIVKGYAYRLVPYILSENPSMSKDEALQESNRLMMGNKWKAFVLDLSFIGWNILCLLTWGVLDIFYVGPYRNATYAAFYEAVKAEKNEAELPTV